MVGWWDYTTSQPVWFKTYTKQPAPSNRSGFFYIFIFIVMTKIRIQNKYWTIPNDLLNHKEITMKAKWLFWYLQSKPENWEFSAERIKMDTKEGVDSIYQWLKELENYWYLTREKAQNDKWRWEWEYILTQTPSTEKPSTENPGTETPSTEKHKINKERNINKEIVKKNNKTTAKAVEEETSLAEEEKKEYWDPEINECLKIIKKYNNWIIDWTLPRQRQFGNHLIKKLKTIDSVLAWKFTRQQILEMILEIVSKNEFHYTKIAWPEKIFRNLAVLQQICRMEISANKWKAPVRQF